MIFRFLEKDESMLPEVHNGICGSHSNGLVLAQKIHRVGYYWPAMQANVMYYVRSYKKYQLHGNLIHAPGHELIPFVTHCPF